MVIGKDVLLRKEDLVIDFVLGPIDEGTILIPFLNPRDDDFYEGIKALGRPVVRIGIERTDPRGLVVIA